MKVIAYKNLCKKKKSPKMFIFCTPSIFKPVVSIMSAVLVLLILNLFVNNFFANLQASIKSYVTSFVRLILSCK